MPSHTTTAALLALGVAAGAASASPIARATSGGAPSSCWPLTSPAGFGYNLSAIPSPYSNHAPAKYLGFENSPYLNANETKDTIIPSNYNAVNWFTPYGCETVFYNGNDEGDSQAVVGFLSSPLRYGHCIGVEKLGVQNTTLVSTECGFTGDGQVADVQRWLFTTNTFNNYVVASFLGNNEPPRDGSVDNQHTGYAVTATDEAMYVSYDPSNKQPEGLAYDLGLNPAWLTATGPTA